MITPEDLRNLGISDPDRALRILVSLAGQGVTDDDVEALLPTILEALRKSPDPDRALNNFSRWIDSVHSRYTHFQYLRRHPAAVDIFFNVCGVSQLFSDILIRNPEYFEILANPGVRFGAKSAGALYRELSSFVAPVQRTELKLEAMRRFKQREFLRIGARDILGLADMPATAREFSNLADACVQACLEVATAELARKHGEAAPPFIIVAMGKLGGRELNYSSDIDLLFVCADEQTDDGRRTTDDGRPNDPTTQRPNGPTTQRPNDLTTQRHNVPIQNASISPLDYSHRLAELVIQYLTKNLQAGHLFRVDMRLRPEGRFGALVRTLSSYRAYYESWAEPWERQALIKARVIAGDSGLADAFQAMVTPYVYRRAATSDFVDSIRRNKERIEQKAILEGARATNVKVGAGGIRDIEFTVQLLQLQFGGRFPTVRTPSTLEALARLRQIGALSSQEAAELADDYRFLRTVEHRLQILYELQTQSLPSDPAERRLLARRLGFADAAAFDAEYARRTQRVRTHAERLFYGNIRRGDPADHWAELVAGSRADTAAAPVAMALEAEGFREPERASAILRGLAFGSDYGETTPETRDLLFRLAGRLIAAATRTGDPDAALRGIETLALASPNPAALYQALLEGEQLLDRLTQLGAGALPQMQLLSRHQEWLDMLVDEEVVDPALKTVGSYLEELAGRTGAPTDDLFLDAIALYIQRERLRIAARDLWGELGPVGVMRELTALAEAVLQALLDRAKRNAARQNRGLWPHLESIALIGLGKLGGREAGYQSDWDVTAVYRKPDVTGMEVFRAVEEVVSFVLSAGPALTARGAPVEIDARLRPEGRVGALAFTPDEYADYYRNSAQTWELQMLTKARFVAGDPETGRSFMEMRDAILYSAPLAAAAREDIRAMKRRIETERLKPEERTTDVKLGHGGMSDIEFFAQMLQLRAGRDHPAVRVPDTIMALQALATAGTLPSPDAARLAESYAFYNGLRNRVALAGVGPANLLPADPQRLRGVAIGMGAADTDTEAAETLFRRQFDERMRETRALFERRFYGDE